MSVGRVLQNLGQHDVILQQALEGKDDVSSQRKWRFGFDLAFVELLLQFWTSLFFLLQDDLSRGEIGTVLFIDEEILIKVEDNLPNVVLPFVQLEQNV